MVISVLLSAMAIVLYADTGHGVPVKEVAVNSNSHKGNGVEHSLKYSRRKRKTGIDDHINLRVGPDYDFKERVFRNPSLSLGALSDFFIEHKWTPSDSAVNVTFYWLDPGGAIALHEILLVKANSTEKVLWTKKKFSEDLETGSWTLLASVDNTLLGYIDFPVFSDLSLQR
ncbi:uncharacterized protein LOC136036870 [Artemia franciscana]